MDSKGNLRQGVIYTDSGNVVIQEGPKVMTKGKILHSLEARPHGTLMGVSCVGKAGRGMRR